MTLHVIARFVSRDESREQLKDILVPLVALIRRDEGCERCHLTQSAANPNEFAFIEEWRDQAAFDAHLDPQDIADAIKQTESLIEGPIDVQQFDPLA